MTNDNYETMMRRLQDLIDKCERYFASIKSKEDLDDMSFRSVIKLTETARAIHGQMDAIVKNELYHVIGMGDLSMMQQYMFIDKIKELNSYRSYVKALACYKIPEPPTIPSDSDYMCKTLGVDLKKEITCGETL